MILYDLISFILIHLHIFIEHIKLQPSDSICNSPTIMSLSPKFKYKNKMLLTGEYIKRPFTEIVSEDDCTFYNILVKGKSLESQRHLDDKKNKSRISIKQAKQCLKNSLVKNKQQQSLKSNWVLNTMKICNNSNKKEQTPLKRSITVESVQKIKKMNYKNRSIHSAIKKIQQKNSEKIFLQKQNSTTRQDNFDKKTHTDFKNIINQFNKVKTEIKQKVAEEQEKKQDKTMRIFYKKPNFYEYQEFYRHNYNMKYLKEEMFLFKKISYAPVKNQREKRLTSSQSQKYKVQQRSKTMNEKKSGVYVLEQSQKSPDKQQKCNMETFLTLQPYLNIKSHQFSKTSRNNIFKRKLNVATCMNKTFCSQKKSLPFIQYEKIQPWASAQNGDLEQNKLTNIF